MKNREYIVISNVPISKESCTFTVSEYVGYAADAEKTVTLNSKTGTYSVIVKNSWSWRYDVTVGDDAYENITSPEFDETTLSVRFVLGVDSKVTFTMERVEDQWLDGDDWYELNLQN